MGLSRRAECAVAHGAPPARERPPMVTEKHSPARRQMFGETRLLMEWLRLEYPGRAWQKNFRVGQDPSVAGVNLEDEGERRLVRNLNRYVDAVVEPPPELVVIEATMFKPTDKVGRLMEYMLLLRATPEWRQWAGAPVVPTLLTAQHDAIAEIMCRRQGFRYVFWEPPWIGEWWALYPRRRRNAPHAGLAEALGAQG